MTQPCLGSGTWGCFGEVLGQGQGALMSTWDTSKVVKAKVPTRLPAAPLEMPRQAICTTLALQGATRTSGAMTGSTLLVDKAFQTQAPMARVVLSSLAMQLWSTFGAKLSAHRSLSSSTFPSKIFTILTVWNHGSERSIAMYLASQTRRLPCGAILVRWMSR